ncbi:putative RING-type E3 ubiquitin transferase C3H69 isoform X1 [Syzygium oleosum]|uniref:putative RING-type E3 ubiquitin transferase C3H69 isoform X1 n=1 Tax=Syzygium oleosum TaxID=219896 RepID=UPI0011D25502|nr:putative RING-type E3 ubiquitin transferase C3H69 isoform X1 [Syzygium oleosum]
MSKRVLCKFFAHGACLKGEHCEYSHDWTAPTNNICTFYQKGICTYGNRCRYEHVKASRPWSGASSSLSSLSSSSSSSSSRTSSQPPISGSVPQVLSSRSGVHSSSNSVEVTSRSRPLGPRNQPAWNRGFEQHDYVDGSDFIESRTVRPADQSICSFAAAGDCPRGEACPHIHGDLCPTCGKHCLHPFRPEEREEHMKTCEKKQKQLEALKLSQEIECSVCLDRVLSKPTAAERKFGILSECDHAFCITCIRNWRSSSPTTGMDVNSSLRACPICRKLSYFVIPSVIWYNSKEEKQEIIDNYKAKLKSIDCKHFNFGDGNCPFGTSCFYKHTVKPGSYTWIHHRPPPRRRRRRRNPANMDAMFGVFEHLLFLESLMGDEDLDFYNVEDTDDDDLTPVEMAFLLAQLGINSGDSSSDRE